MQKAGGIRMQTEAIQRVSGNLLTETGITSMKTVICRPAG